MPFARFKERTGRCREDAGHVPYVQKALCRDPNKGWLFTNSYLHIGRNSENLRPGGVWQAAL
jgi:hypothetical protein